MRERRAALTQARATHAAQREHAAALRAEVDERAAALRTATARVAHERARLLRDLDAIYDIQLCDARELLFSIASLPLLNGVATTTKHGRELVHASAHQPSVEAALVLVAQLVLLLRQYLSTNLPYPVLISRGRTAVCDPVSVTAGPRAYVAV